MKKKITTIIYAVILCIMFAMPVMAAGGPRLVDDADLLTESQETALTEKLDKISEKHKCDVIIVTANSLEGKNPTAYADDYFDYNGYGFGDECDGILLLISMEDRDWAISTCGFGIDAFSDADQEYIVDEIIDDLSSGNYNAAFTEFAELCDEFIAKEKNPLGLKWILYSILIGAAIAFCITWYMRMQLKSVHRQPAAKDYVRDGSFVLEIERDRYLYKKLDKRAKPKDNGSSGRSGSSTHRSSSGRSHGGSRGKF